MRNLSQDEAHEACNGLQSSELQTSNPSNFNPSKLKKRRGVKFFKSTSHHRESGESSEVIESLESELSRPRSVWGSMAFGLGARLAIYSLLLQSILPCFAWAASAEVQPQPLALSSHLDRPVERRLIYLPQIHQEPDVTEEKERKSEAPKVGQGYAIDLSNIDESIERLKDVYTGLRKIGEAFEWSAYGLVFTYTPANDLHIEGKQGAPGGSTLKIDKISKSDRGEGKAGKIVIEQGLQLDTLMAPHTHVENRGANTVIKNLTAKYFSQASGFALTTQRLICSQGFNNAGVLAAADTLYLEIEGKALNSGTIKAHTLEGKIKELDNTGLVEAEFKRLEIGNLQNQHQGQIKGKGHIRVQQGTNAGNITARRLKLELLSEGKEFIHNGTIVSTSRLEVLGKGTFREGKESRLQTPLLSLNSSGYENFAVHTTPHEQILVGSNVRVFINHEDAVLEAKAMEFLGHAEATLGSFKNLGSMKLGRWVNGARHLHNELTGDITVTGDTSFTDAQSLINEGKFESQGSLTGRINDLVNKGELTVTRDLRLAGTKFLNEKLIRIQGRSQWEGKSFQNSGQIYIVNSDIIAHLEFVTTKQFESTGRVQLRGESLSLGGKVVTEQQFSLQGTRIQTDDRLTLKAQELKLQSTSAVELKGSWGVTTSATIYTPKLTVSGKLLVAEDVYGSIQEIVNNGEICVDRDFRVEGTSSLTNERGKRFYVGHLFSWTGENITNRGLMGMQYCDIAVRRQFINYGTFLWTHYTLRGSHILNLGLMEQKQKIGQEVWRESKAVQNQSTGYRHFTVENRGILKLQTDYIPERAPHQRTGVRFREWDNSGTFLDTSRVLEAKSFRNTGGYHTQGSLTGHVDEFISTGKLSVGSLKLTSQGVTLSGKVESKGKASFKTKQFRDTALQMKVDALELRITDYLTSLTMAGTYDVGKLDIDALSLTVKGTVKQKDESKDWFHGLRGTTYNGYSVTVEAKGTFDVGDFRVPDRRSVYNYGKFRACWANNSYLEKLVHRSTDTMVIDGDLTVDEFSDKYDWEQKTQLPATIRLGYSALLRIGSGAPKVIEAQGPIDLLLNGAEDKIEHDWWDPTAKVICSSDEIPIIRTQHKATVHFGPQYNVETYLRGHLLSQEYEDSQPLELRGGLFQSTGNLEYHKPLRINVDSFVNRHHLGLGPTTIRARTFNNSGILECRGATQITSSGDLNNTGKISATDALEEKSRHSYYQRVISPGTLTLISETGSIHVGTGAYAVSKDKLTLQSLRGNINVTHGLLKSHKGISLNAAETIHTITSRIEAIGSINLEAKRFNHHAGAVQSSSTPGRKHLMARDSFGQVMEIDVPEHDMPRARNDLLQQGMPSCWIHSDPATPNRWLASPGSKIESQDSVNIRIGSGECASSHIYAARNILVNGTALTRSGVSGFSVHSNGGLEAPQIEANHKVAIQAGTVAINGGYVRGSHVVIAALLFYGQGGSGARGAMTQSATSDLGAEFAREFVRQAQGFYTRDERGAYVSVLDQVNNFFRQWPHGVLVTNPTTGDQRIADQGFNLTYEQAQQAVTAALRGHGARVPDPTLDGRGLIERAATQARTLITQVPRGLSVEEHFRAIAQEPLLHAQDKGDALLALFMTLPGSQDGRVFNIAADELDIEAEQNIMLTDFRMCGAKKLKLRSGGRIDATTTSENKVIIDKDGWVTELTVHRDHNLITGGIVEIEAQAGIGLRGVEVVSEKDLLITSREGGIEITGVIDEEKATRSQSTGVRDLGSYDGGWDYHAQEEFRTGQQARQSSVRAGGDMRITTPAALRLTGVNIATEMTITLEGKEVTVETPHETFTYARESVSRSGSRLRERVYVDKRSESSSESLPAARSQINAGVLTVVAQVLDLVGVQASLGVLNDRTQVFKLTPVVAESKREAHESHYHSARGFAGIGHQKQRGQAQVTERVSQPMGSLVVAQEAHHGDPQAPGGQLIIDSSELKEGVAHVSKSSIIMRSTPATRQLESSSSSRGMKHSMRPTLLPQMPSSRDGFGGQVKSVSSIVQTANQVFGAIRLWQENKLDPLMFAVQKLSPTISWSHQEQKSHVSQSQDVPSAIHWGVVKFEGKPTFHIKGYVDIGTLSGALGSLTSEPLRVEHKLEAESHSSHHSVSPVNLSFSWSESDYKRLESDIKHLRSRLNIVSGDLVIEGDAEFFGIKVEGRESHLVVGGKKTLRSAMDIHEEKVEQSHQGLSVSLDGLLPWLPASFGLAALPTLLGSGAAVTGNTFSFLKAASSITPSLGDSVREIREEKSVEAELDLASGHEQSESFYRRSESQSSNLMGRVLEGVTTGLAVGQLMNEGQQLVDNVSSAFIALTTIKAEAREALEQDGFSEQEAKEIVNNPEVEQDLETLSHVRDLLDAPPIAQPLSQEGKREGKSEERPSILSERELQQWTQAYVASLSDEQEQGLSPGEIRRGGNALARHMKKEYDYQRSLGLDEGKAWTNVRFRLIETQEYMQSQPQYREIVWPQIARGLAKASPYVAQGVSAVKTGTAALLAKLGKMIGRGGQKAAEAEAKVSSSTIKQSTSALQEALSKAQWVEDRLETVLENGSKVVFRKDFGDKAHRIKGYVGNINHYNVEIHTPIKGRIERYDISTNIHIIIDELGNVTKILR